DVEQAGRDLPQHSPHRVAVLVDEDDLLALGSLAPGDDRDRAGVVDELPQHRLLVVGPAADVLPDEVEDPAGVEHPATGDLTAVVAPALHRHWRSAAPDAGISSARWVVRRVSCSG